LRIIGQPHLQPVINILENFKEVPPKEKIISEELRFTSFPFPGISKKPSTVFLVFYPSIPSFLNDLK
jgi:hypothetical protein